MSQYSEKGLSFADGAVLTLVGALGIGAPPCLRSGAGGGVTAVRAALSALPGSPQGFM